MAHRKWKPTKAEAQDFARKMAEIEDFCFENEISHSRSYDSFYFVLNGQRYRVSNHSVEASNRAAYDDFGNLKRKIYHDGGREEDVRYIHASKTRIIDIYRDLQACYELDGRGNRIG